jgi:pyruvate dehydrogenase E2 component (dihydrolipoamide acetyltransferase)
MPSLGMAMDEGQVVKWHVAPGDVVEAGQVILEIESEKTTAEIEAPAGGEVGELLVAAGDTVPVDTILVRIGNGTDNPVEQSQAEPPPPAPRRASVISQPSNARTPGRASPRARKLAEDLGVDWTSLQGTAPDGSVVEADIRAAAGAIASKGTSDDATAFFLRPISPAQKRVAERTAESARTAPHYFISNDARADALVTTLAAVRAKGGDIRVTLNDLILWATAQVLPRHQPLNSSYSDDGVQEWKEVNLGFVAAVAESLIVPVIRHADKLTFDELVGARSELLERARGNRLQPGDMLGGTFSVSNLGPVGVERFSSILNRGQSGILSVGALKERPAIVDGRIEPAPFISLTLTVDHRCVDGVVAGRFLADLGEQLETLAVAQLNPRQVSPVEA